MANSTPDRFGYGAWNETAVGTNSGVSVTHTLGTVTGTKRAWCTGIQCSGDAAALVTIESPAGTILYKKRFAAAFNMSESFASPKKGADAQNILVKISASTSNCEGNIDGYDG